MESVREEAPDGNIIRKGDAGEMVYTNPNRPYAVTGNTLMAGGSFLNALGNGTMGAFSGAICGGALEGVIGGGTAIIKGQNFVARKCHRTGKRNVFMEKYSCRRNRLINLCTGSDAGCYA